MKLIKGILDLLMAAFILIGMLLSVPRLWGFQIYAVTSGSMEPEIHTGDVIYVKQVAFQSLEEGDVITFSLNQGRTIVTHRVEKIDEKNGLLRTKGDANQEADPVWIAGDTVRGEVQYAVPGLGYVALMASTLSGKLFLMAVFLWMVAAQIAVCGVHMICHNRRRLPLSEKKEGRRENYV